MLTKNIKYLGCRVSNCFIEVFFEEKERFTAF